MKSVCFFCFLFWNCKFGMDEYEECLEWLAQCQFHFFKECSLSFRNRNAEQQKISIRRRTMVALRSSKFSIAFVTNRNEFAKWNRKKCQRSSPTYWKWIGKINEQRKTTCVARNRQTVVRPPSPTTSTHWQMIKTKSKWRRKISNGERIHRTMYNVQYTHSKTAD